MVVGARGTIGGITFSANQAGPYVKSWSKGSNPQTALHSAQRGILTDFASNWRNLTSAERDDWDDYADDAAQELTNSLGETYFISGFAWYVRINTHLTLAGEADRDDAPTLTRPVAPIIQGVNLFVTGAAGNTAVQYTVGDPDLTANHVVFSRLVYSQGVRSIPVTMPLMAIGVPNVNRAVIIETEVEATFGTIQLGSRLLVSTSIQDAHGQRGPVDTATADASL